MKPEEEIVTARITRKEAETIAARRWLKTQKKTTKRLLALFVVGFVLALVLMFVDSPPGSPKETHNIGANIALPIAVMLIVAGGLPAFLFGLKADRIGKEEASKLIV